MNGRSYFVGLLLMAASFSMCLADDQDPKYCIVRNKSDLIFLHRADQPEITIRKLAPLFDWEGTCSHTLLRDNAGTISVDFILDIYGSPDWLRVALRETPKGLLFYVERSRIPSNMPYEYFSSKYFKDYDELMSDDEIKKLQYDVLLRKLWERCGLPADPPDITHIRRHIFNFKVHTNPLKDVLCMFLIAQLDSENWYVRNNAYAAISTFNLTRRALKVSRMMPRLSFEQRDMLNELSASLQFPVMEEFKQDLAKIILTPRERVHCE